MVQYERDRYPTIVEIGNPLGYKVTMDIWLNVSLAKPHCLQHGRSLYIGLKTIYPMPSSPPKMIFFPSCKMQKCTLQIPFWLFPFCIFYPINFKFLFVLVFSLFFSHIPLFSLPPFHVLSQMTSADITLGEGGEKGVEYFLIYTTMWPEVVDL